MCPMGWHGKMSAGQDTCLKCDYGEYTDQVGAAMCFACQAGRKAAQQGLTACAECNPGQFRGAGRADATQCNDCPSGKFSDDKGQAICLLW